MVRSIVRSERRRQPFEASLVGRQPEPQQVAGPFKPAAPDVLPRQSCVPPQRVGMSGEPKQRRASGDPKASLLENGVKPAGSNPQFTAHPIGPGPIVQRCRTDMQRGSGARPGPDRAGQTPCDIGPTDRKAKTNTGQAVKFSERAQHHHRPIHRQRHRADGRVDIGKGLIDDKPATPMLQTHGQLRQHRRFDDTAIGIVGIDDDSMNGILGKTVETTIGMTSRPALRQASSCSP